MACICSASHLQQLRRTPSDLRLQRIAPAAVAQAAQWPAFEGAQQMLWCRAPPLACLAPITTEPACCPCLTRSLHCLTHSPSSCCQVLVYFAVAKKGDAPTDGKTDVNPEGLTAAYGPHAAVVAARLHAAGLSCKVGKAGRAVALAGMRRWQACGAAELGADWQRFKHAAARGALLCSCPWRVVVRAAAFQASLRAASPPPPAGAGPPRLHVPHAGEADLDLRLHAGGRAARRLHRGRGGVAGELCCEQPLDLVASWAADHMVCAAALWARWVRK